MKIAFNTLPLKTAHKTRGIGYYTRKLLVALEEEEDIEVLKFDNLSEIRNLDVVDVVHYPWFDFFFHTLPIRKRYPTVVTIHDVIPLKFKKHYPMGLKGRLNLLLQKQALKNCKFIIADSLTSKKDISQYLNIGEEKITPIYLAADSIFKILPQRDLLRVKRKYHLADRLLLYVGDANWVKNLPFLIAGFNKVVKTYGFEDIKLILVGGVFLKNVENIDHPELQSLRHMSLLIKEFKLENNIIRPGQISDEDLAVFYNLATIYIQPSLYEGFGLPVLQAFSCGTPVVSSNRGALSEIGGNAAVYFDPTDMNQFISIIKEIVQNKSLQNKLSKLGLKQGAKFSWKKIAEQTKSVYFRAKLRF